MTSGLGETSLGKVTGVSLTNWFLNQVFLARPIRTTGTVGRSGCHRGLEVRVQMVESCR